MLEEYSRPAFSRRRLFCMAGASVASWRRASGFGGREFWDAKDPAEWNSDEIAKLLSKSPWAKTAAAERAGRMPRGNRRRPASRDATTYQGTVVWESAAPVRAALKTALPDGFDGQHVLGVTGLPLSRSDSGNALARVKQVTTLQCKGGQPVAPSTVQEDSTNGIVYLLGFSRQALALSKEVKDVVFTTHLGRLAFTAKFNPKDMLYHGELAC